MTIPIIINVASVFYVFFIAVNAYTFYKTIALRAMDINALVISGSDLGAVPSGSTINRNICGHMGSK